MFYEEREIEEKEKIRKILIDYARRELPICYSDLVDKIKADGFITALHAHDTRLFNLLGEISREEFYSDPPRPMLSAIVIGKSDSLPGTGFFNLAKELHKYEGTNKKDQREFWNSEFKRVCDYWRNQ
ncbi:MAG: hypothetical protein ACYDBP_06630 [Leptospirales bacterium]